MFELYANSFMVHFMLETFKAMNLCIWFQSGIFDETLDRFEDIPVGTSPLSLSFSSFGNSNSPTSLATAATTSGNELYISMATNQNRLCAF